MMVLSRQASPWRDPRFLGAVLGGLLIAGLAGRAMVEILWQRWAEASLNSPWFVLVSIVAAIGFLVYWIRLLRSLWKNIVAVHSEAKGQ